MADNEEGGLKINDRRRFDSEGNEKVEQQTAQNATSRSQNKEVDINISESSNSKSTIINTDNGNADQADKDLDAMPTTDGIDFSAFVMSLATQALMQLGLMQAPQGVTLPVDKEAAKQTIEILSMLKTKTVGNLDKEEQKLIEEILHSLRMSFVREG